MDWDRRLRNKLYIYLTILSFGYAYSHLICPLEIFLLVLSSETIKKSQRLNATDLFKNPKIEFEVKNNL